MGGICHGAGYRKRITALERARILLGTLRHTLGFTLAPPTVLLEILQNDPMLKDCDYLACAQKKSNKVDFETAWKQAVEQSDEPFAPPDRKLLTAVGGIIGSSDLETQTGQLKLLSEQLEALLHDARESCEKNSRLSSTLGALLGLAIVVILF